MDDQGGAPGAVSRIPAQIEVAFDVVSWVASIETGWGPMGRADPRELRSAEKAAYGAAVEVLRLYLSGEMTFASETSSSDRQPVLPEPEQANVKTPP